MSIRPLTPDLIAMPLNPDGSTLGSVYHGWMDSGESQIGFNRILSDTVPLGSLAERLSEVLPELGCGCPAPGLGRRELGFGRRPVRLPEDRLGRRDEPGLQPLPATTGDTLTLPFSADTLVWVTGSQTAQMLRWNGAAWADALPGGLPPEDFRFTAHAPASLTDLYLPFNLLGIADPATTPLDMIAFGSQEACPAPVDGVPDHQPARQPDPEQAAAPAARTSTTWS